MAIILKVSPDKLLSTAAELESQGSTMKTYTDQMVNLVNEISGDVWSGDAATAYKTKFSGLQDDIARIHKMVQERVQDLQDIARNYTEAETANQEIANSLSSDVIV